MARAKVPSVKAQPTTERPVHKRHRTPPPTLQPDEDIRSDTEHVEPIEHVEDEDHIPRPRNAWIIFRSSELERYKDVDATGNSKKPQALHSKDIAIRWRSFTEEQKRPWTNQAIEEKARHKLMYPGYKFQPKSKEVKAAIREAERVAKVKIKAEQTAALQQAKITALRKYASAAAANATSSSNTSPPTDTAQSYLNTSSRTTITSRDGDLLPTTKYNTVRIFSPIHSSLLCRL